MDFYTYVYQTTWKHAVIEKGKLKASGESENLKS